MKFWTWLKGLGWLAVGGAIFAAVMMVLRAFSAGKMEAEIEHDESRITDLQTGTAVEIQEAAKLQKSIGVKKIKAREIRKKAEKHQERIGQNETMADIADRFNNKSGRVRSRSDKAAELRDG